MIFRFVGMAMAFSGMLAAAALESSLLEESQSIALAYKELRSIVPERQEEGKLAPLYTARGESYLVSGLYAQAVADFEAGYDQLVSSWVGFYSDALLFRIFLGEVIAYDQLGMEDSCRHALARLSSIACDAGCSDCLEESPCPDDSPERAVAREQAAEEAGARLMQLAGLALSSEVQQILSGLTDALTERAHHCCDACAFLSECSAQLIAKLEVQ